MSDALTEHGYGSGERTANLAAFVPDLVMGETKRRHAGEHMGTVALSISRLS